jgi:CheY-like chemotaxis protein
MKDKILFVDDEVFFARPYVTELEKKFDVFLRETSDAAVAEFRGTADFMAAVVDVMMPPPEGLAVSTLDGMDTGLWILQECKEMIVARRIPVIVLTNRNSIYVKESISAMNFPPGLIIVHSKIETPKFYLPHLLEQLIASWRSKQ